MIFGLTYSAFFLVLLCAFAAGMLGAASILLLARLNKKKKEEKNRASFQTRSGWQRISRDEQLYNGR